MAVPEITASELKQRLDQGQPLVLVDVREPLEWSIADLGEYAPVRMPTGEFADRMDELDPDDNIVVYCRSGSRSAWAVGMLQAQGFDKVFNLQGGILAWKDQVDPSLRSY
ncbi:MAG: rhodanese-like domain-containing protein [Gemmatimonadota bacterium]|nr:hypothetical protein [Gemmatimonadota bacterium]